MNELTLCESIKNMCYEKHLQRCLTCADVIDLIYKTSSVYPTIKKLQSGLKIADMTHIDVLTINSLYQYETILVESDDAEQNDLIEKHCPLNLELKYLNSHAHLRIVPDGGKRRSQIEAMTFAERNAYNEYQRGVVLDSSCWLKLY